MLLGDEHLGKRLTHGGFFQWHIHTQLNVMLIYGTSLFTWSSPATGLHYPTEKTVTLLIPEMANECRRSKMLLGMVYATVSMDL